jgi:hypothetical protein
MALGSINWFSLGATVLPYDGNSMGLDIPYMDIIHISYSITGYAVNDTAQIRFNNDSSGIYAYHVIAYDSIYSTTPATSESYSTAASGIRTSGVQSTGMQSGTIHVSCMPSVGHNTMTIMNSTFGAAPSAFEMVGSGDYASADQITYIELSSLSGNNMLAGSGFSVFGCNLG